MNERFKTLSVLPDDSFSTKNKRMTLTIEQMLQLEKEQKERVRLLQAEHSASLYNYYSDRLTSLEQSVVTLQAQISHLMQAAKELQAKLKNS